jgi:hypothetical protein
MCLRWLHGGRRKTWAALRLDHARPQLKQPPDMLPAVDFDPFAEHLVHSNLIPAALMIGHHFSISAF